MPHLRTLLTASLEEHIHQYVTDYSQILDLNESAKYTIINVSGSFFQRGYRTEIDLLQDQMTEIQDYFLQLSQQLSTLAGGKSYITYEPTEEIHLETTTARWTTCASRYTRPIVIQTTHHRYLVPRDSLEIIKNRTGKTCKITSNEIKSLSVQLKEHQDALVKLVVETYKQFLSQTYDRWHECMDQMVHLVAEIDVYASLAKTSLLYHYCRPQIVTGTPLPRSPSPHLDALQIRHPLIEQLQESCQYVPQDLQFNPDQQGVLLFGTNAVGKSSLMKAIGIAVILAQAGMYVPAQKFVYQPYHCIMTRIIGNDNLFKGMSSFAVEMSELRSILKRAAVDTLVLGDEICHGTETYSGVAIISSAIITLARLGANFLFATHLHQLTQIDQVTQLSMVKMYHLQVEYEEKTGELVYDRRLMPGAGNPIYGLEVAKAMNLDREFIQLANQIRKDLLGIHETKKSKYNSEVYLNQCAIPGCSRPAELTHHIRFQSEADPNGFIDQHLHKNHRSNLIGLCQQCHAMVHDDQPGHWRYQINGFKMTTQGPVLDYIKVLGEPSAPPPKFILKLKS